MFLLKILVVVPFDHLSRNTSCSQMYFLRNWNIHQLKLGSSAMPIWISNMATWTGWDSLRSDRFYHEVELSFYWQQMNQPFVDLHMHVVPLTMIFF